MTIAQKLKLVKTDNKDNKKTSSRDQLAEYFYRISNHEELFRIGKTFSIEVEKGVSSFAFTSTGYKNSQQKAILGLCCYFDQNENYKIAVISDQLNVGAFSELLDLSIPGTHQLSAADELICYRSFHHHFDFIDYLELSKFYDNRLYTKNFEIEIKKILENYDLVFWDVPEIEKMKNHPHFHYRISHLYESMTVIVSQNITSGKQVESIKNFFSNYNINLNGVLFDFSNDEEKPRRKKFLGLF